MNESTVHFREMPPWLRFDHQILFHRMLSYTTLRINIVSDTSAKSGFL